MKPASYKPAHERLHDLRNRMGGFAGREMFFVLLDPETNQPTNESPFFFAETICGNFRLV